MKLFLTFLVLGFLGSCAGTGLVAKDRATGVATTHLSFETMFLGGWEGQFSPGNFQFSSHEPASGSSCGRFFLGANRDYWTSPNNGGLSARSELQLFQTANVNTDMYYSWYLKIDKDYQESDDWQVMGQFHDQPDFAAGETWSTYPAHSPPLSFKYRNQNLTVAVYDWKQEKIVDIATIPLEKGVWNQVTSHVYWSVADNGIVECWVNGVPVASPKGQRTYLGRNCFNLAGNYLKIGLYRDMKILTEATVYYDDVKIGRSREDVL